MSSLQQAIPTVLALCDQVVHERRRKSQEPGQATRVGVQPMGAASRRLYEYLCGLPGATVRKLAVLYYCGRSRVKDTHVADNIIYEPKERLVGQLMEKGPLGACMRDGLALVDLDELGRFDEAA